MKSIKLFGKSIPLWAVTAVLLVAIVGAVVAQNLIGTVRMPWEVVPPPPRASMSPSEVTLEIGTIYFGETKTVEPVEVGVLTVENGPVDLTFTLNGDSSPGGCGGWSDKQASQLGYVETCFVRVLAGEGDLAQLVKWVPGATITVDDQTYEYPNTPFGYVYDETIPETGYIFQNDNDAGEAIQLVLVYPSTSATIENVQPGTYDVYIGYTVTAGNVASSGEAVLSISYSS